MRLHEFTHRSLAEDSVRGGVGDLGIGPPPIDWGGPVRRLGWEEFLVVLPPEDPLAARRSVRLLELKERDWVMFEPGNGMHDLIVSACASAGFTPRHAVLTSQVETAARLAAAGAGPTLVPENVIPDGLEGDAPARGPAARPRAHRVRPPPVGAARGRVRRAHGRDALA